MNKNFNKRLSRICPETGDYKINGQLMFLTGLEDYILFKKDFICSRYSRTKSYEFAKRMQKIMDTHYDVFESLGNE